MGMRGVRGAITVEQNEKEAIWQAAKAMMQELIERNELAPEDIGAVIFSMTEDLSRRLVCASCRASTSCRSLTRVNVRLRAAWRSAFACSCSPIREKHSVISTTSIWERLSHFVLIYAEHHGIGTKSYKISTSYCTFYIKSCRIDGVRGFIRNFQNQVVRRDTL